MISWNFTGWWISYVWPRDLKSRPQHCPWLSAQTAAPTFESGDDHRFSDLTCCVYHSEKLVAVAGGGFRHLGDLVKTNLDGLVLALLDIVGWLDGDSLKLCVMN